MTHSGGKPHTNVGDKGQRFEVTFFNMATNTRQVLGWAITQHGANEMAVAVELHPSWKFPQIEDRWGKQL